jgi:sulfate adenylyltransferase subunit 2
MTNTHADYRLSQLDQLEAESIHIFREVAAEFEKPVLMFSGGKDSIVMLRLAEKAFYPAKIPFPLLQVDTGLDFPRSSPRVTPGSTASASRMIVATIDEAIARRGLMTARPAATASRSAPCSTPSRRAASPPPSVAVVATRRRPAPRSASTPTATSSASGTPRISAPSCGASTTAASTRASTCGSSRSPTGPSSTCGTTSHREQIEIPEIYFAHERRGHRARRHAAVARDGDPAQGR